MIFLLSEIFPPTHGGSGRWFFELYRRLKPNSTVIFTNDNGSDEQHTIDDAFPQAIKRIRFTSTQWGLKSLTGLTFYARTIFSVLKLRRMGISQLHCGRCIPEGFIGLIVAKLLRKPLVCYIHGEDVEVARTSREIAIIVRLVLKGSNKLICNSTNTRNLLMEHWQVSTDKIEVINPGVDVERFTAVPVDVAFKEKMDWADNFVCLTVGRLQRRKGHDKMIEAIPQIISTIPNLKYSIVGSGEQLEYLQGKARDLNVSSYVQFLSEIDDSELIQCYQQCDLFILPNRADGNDIEGFGMVLAEAQACGKPVIAGKSGGTADALRDGKTGMLIDCTDPANIAYAITYMKHAVTAGAFTAERSVEFIHSSLTWQIHAKRANAVFAEMDPNHGH